MSDPANEIATDAFEAMQADADELKAILQKHQTNTRTRQELEEENRALREQLAGLPDPETLADEWCDFERYVELKKGAKNRDWIYKQAARVEAALAKATVHIRDQDSHIAASQKEIGALRTAIYKVAVGDMRVRVATNPETGQEQIEVSDAKHAPSDDSERPYPTPLVLPPRYDG